MLCCAAKGADLLELGAAIALRAARLLLEDGVHAGALQRLALQSEVLIRRISDRLLRILGWFFPAAPPAPERRARILINGIIVAARHYVAQREVAVN